MNRFTLRWLGVAALALTSPALVLAQPALLALYKDRADGSHRLHDIVDNVAVGSPLASCCNTVSGTLTFDPASRDILLVSQGDTHQELVRIHAGSGTLSGRAPIAGGWRILAAAYDRTRATLFGIGRSAAGDRHLVTIAPASGAVSPVGASLSAAFAFVPGGHGLHPRRGQWHLLGHTDGTSAQQVMTLSLDTGATLTTAPVQAYTLSNLYFDEGSGRLLGLGRAHGASQSSMAWLDPGTGHVTALTASGTPNCCPWVSGSLTSMAADGVAGAQFLGPDGSPTFLLWLSGQGTVVGDLPQAGDWALHGLITDQTVFIGDHLFQDGFQLVSKPTRDGLFR